MIFNSDAIVLKTTKTGESDRLVTFLTKERGVFKAFAKSADRPKNKLHMSTNMFCYGHFTFFEGIKSSKVEECELSETFFGLQSDISKLALAQYFNELMIETAPIESDAEIYLRLLLNSLYFLAETKRDMRIIKALFELRTASLNGYMPSLVACKECGEFETETMYFNEQSGELFCSACRRKGASPYPLEIITAMRHIVFSDFGKLFSLSLSEENIPRLNFVCEKYLMENVRKKFKSLDFFNSTVF